jgi:3-oxoacyl-[acyl-carrier-protein] synthase III
MKNNIGIEAIEYFLPKKITTSSELADSFGYDLDFIEQKIGIKKLYSSSKNSSTKLGVKAMEKLLKRFPNLRDEIDLLVVCTQTPDYQLPQVSSQIQDLCKLPNTIIAFDISLGCSGFVYGLSIIESMMKSLNLKKAVLITTESYSHIIDNNDRNTKCLFSDASAATLFSNNAKLISGQFSFGTDGSYYDSLIVGSEKNQGLLYMDGRAIFNFTSLVIPEEIKKNCNLNNLSLSDINYFVLHQASSFVIQSIAKRSGLAGDIRFIDYLDHYGNTVSSSIPIALKKLMNDQGKESQNIFISGFGVGLSWGSSVLRALKEVQDV